jgi:hypothetical protein
MSKQASSRRRNCDRRMGKQRAWGLRVQNLRLHHLTEVLQPDHTHAHKQTIGDSNRGGRGGTAAADLVLQNSQTNMLKSGINPLLQGR